MLRFGKEAHHHQDSHLISHPKTLKDEEAGLLLGKEPHRCYCFEIHLAADCAQATFKVVNSCPYTQFLSDIFARTLT